MYCGRVGRAPSCGLLVNGPSKTPLFNICSINCPYIFLFFLKEDKICPTYSKTCVREPPSRLTLNSGWCGKSCLSYKGTCHVILLAKLHDMYLYKTTTFPHQPLRSISKVAVLHRFYCTIWGDDWHFTSLSTLFVIMRWWKTDNERLCAMKFDTSYKCMIRASCHMHTVKTKISLCITAVYLDVATEISNMVLPFLQLMQQFFQRKRHCFPCAEINRYLETTANIVHVTLYIKSIRRNQSKHSYTIQKYLRECWVRKVSNFLDFFFFFFWTTCTHMGLAEVFLMSAHG